MAKALAEEAEAPKRKSRFQRRAAAIAKAKKEAEKVKSDVNDAKRDEVNVEDIADPHLRDLYRMRRRYRIMMKKAEETLDSSDGLDSKSAYILINFYREYREVISEIRSIEDQNEFAAIVFTKVIQPHSNQVYQNFSDTMFHMVAEVRNVLGTDFDKIKPAMERMLTEHARYLTQSTSATLEKLEGIFTAQ